MSPGRAALLLAISLQSFSCSDPDEDLDPVRFVQVTDDAIEDRRSSISPDGRYVAFGRRQGASLDIWVKSVDGTISRQLTSDPRDEDEPAWSPDGEWIAYTKDVSGQCPEIYRIPPGGGAAEFLTYGREPSWDKTSTKLVLQACPDTAIGFVSGIAYYSLADSTTTPIPGIGRMVAEPAYSSLSDKVAVTGLDFSQDFPADIWIVDSEVAGQITHTGSASSPTWSPDDKYLAYSSHDSLFIMQLADSVVRVVDTSSIAGTLRPFFPAWSRNGDAISITIERGSVCDIFVMQNVSTFLKEF